MAYSQIDDVFDDLVIGFSKEDLDRLIEDRLVILSIPKDRCKDSSQHMKAFADLSMQNDFFYETKR